MSPRFRIGIDLGTTNCALASIAAGDPEGRSVVLEIPQPETGHSTAFALTLPSCLYLPPGGDAWIAGRVEAGPKQLLIEPLGLRFGDDALQLR